MISVAELLKDAETAESVLKVLEPAVKEVLAWFQGGPAPAAIKDYPSELQSVAALERARYRARVTSDAADPLSASDR